VILYGHEPRQWGPVNCSVPDLDLWLKERQMVTELLKQNLHRAQQLDPFSSLSLPILPQGLNHLAISFHLHFHPEPLSLANRTVSRHAISSIVKGSLMLLYFLHAAAMNFPRESLATKPAPAMPRPVNRLEASTLFKLVCRA
jgi:hypothetical protein